MSLRVVIVSTYPPRRCGLASFAQDLRGALAETMPDWRVGVCAVDRGRQTYGPEVLATISQDDQADYRRAAARIAEMRAGLVVIEHEFGIFGGPDGIHVLNLVEELRRWRVPYVVTLHTVLAHASSRQQGILIALCAGAAAVTVFTAGARHRLIRNGVCAPGRVAVVPHGAPIVLRDRGGDLPLRPDVRDALRRLGGGRVLSTFGLIGPGKGLETAIMALPAIMARHPDTQYLIAGATHPDVLRDNGESYRVGLAALADRLQVAGNVHFLDVFATEAELSALLARTDLYLTPYRCADQACSGALTFAIAAGRPAVATAYHYAEEILAPRSWGAPGHTVPCDDSAALAAVAGDLLADPERLAAAGAAADALGATLTWPAVAMRLAGVLATAAAGHARPRLAVPGWSQPQLAATGRPA